jgi:transposase
MRLARQIVLQPYQREILQRHARARSLPARVVERARIVLLAAAGLQDKQIAAELRITPETAARWRNRFLDGGLAALEKDAPRPGRHPRITAAKVREVLDRTTREKPARATRWSTRTMAKATGISEASVRRIWHAHGLNPRLAPPGKTIPVASDNRQSA